MTAQRLSITGVVIASLVLCCAFGSGARAQSAEPSGVVAGGALSNPLAAQPLERLSATRDRPLFSPSRRPPPPPPLPPPVVQAPPPPPPPPPNVTLFGIVIDDEGARAIIRTGSNQVDRVEIGDDVGGWKVSQIEGRRLVLSLNERRATFMLFNSDGDKQSPGAADSNVGRSAGPARESAPAPAATPQSSAPPPPSSRRRRRSRH